MNKDLQISILTEELTVARALLRIKEAELTKVRSELELAKMKDVLFFGEEVNKTHAARLYSDENDECEKFLEFVEKIERG